MRAAIRRILASPPPGGAVGVVVAGLLVTIAAVLLSRTPGEAGKAVPYQAQNSFPESATVAFAKGGNTQIVDGLVSETGANEEDNRLYTIETSLRARAGSGLKINLVRCEVRLPKGVHIGQSEGRRAAFPRPLANSADDAIKEGVPVDFPNGEAQQAGVAFRNVFFKYVVGGNPSVEWPNLAEGQHVWLWRYPTPVVRTRDNFAIVLVAKGGQTVRLACTPEAKGVGVTERATARTSVRLP
jgi:hypothetical protein